MAVESVKSTATQMAQDMYVRNMRQNQNLDQTNQMQSNNQRQGDRVTLNSRSQDTNQAIERNPALGVPGQSQRPTALKVEANAQTNNNSMAAQLIQETVNRANIQQATNPYNPNKPNQTQNQINYTV